MIHGGRLDSAILVDLKPKVTKHIGRINDDAETLKGLKANVFSKENAKTMVKLCENLCVYNADLPQDIMLAHHTSLASAMSHALRAGSESCSDSVDGEMIQILQEFVQQVCITFPLSQEFDEWQQRVAALATKNKMKHRSVTACSMLLALEECRDSDDPAAVMAPPSAVLEFHQVNAGFSLEPQQDKMVEQACSTCFAVLSCPWAGEVVQTWTSCLDILVQWTHNELIKQQVAARLALRSAELAHKDFLGGVEVGAALDADSAAGGVPGASPKLSAMLSSLQRCEAKVNALGEQDRKNTLPNHEKTLEVVRACVKKAQTIKMGAAEAILSTSLVALDGIAGGGAGGAMWSAGVDPSSQWEVLQTHAAATIMKFDRANLESACIIAGESTAKDKRAAVLADA